MSKIVSLLLLVLLIMSVSCLHLDRQKHSRAISQECCKKKGGFQCGNVVKDCCVLPKGVTQEKANADNCLKAGLFGSSQYCPGDKITTPCDYCATACESKGGVICGWENTAGDQCCKESDCITNINLDLKMKKCKQATEIKLPQCVADMNLSDQVFGKLSGVVG